MTQPSKTASSAVPPHGRYGARLAQAAGSLSTLALLPIGAQADVVYHSTGFTVGMNANTYWDVDGNGSKEFRFHGTGSYLYMDSIGSNGRGLVQAAGMTNADAFQKLAMDSVVGPNLAGGYKWGGAGQAGRLMLSSSLNSNIVIGKDAKDGDFVGGGSQYFGFRFTKGVNLFYGWGELNFDLANGQLSVTRWAYNNIPNFPIPVGLTLPEPSTASLALLGLGLGGLRAFRARKQQTALNG